MKKKNLAFTLAEVLIVIGIIGVVAALTLPNLNHATGDKETVTRLQKAYSILNEANDRAVAIYGPVSTWQNNGGCENGISRCWVNRVSEFMKISKNCGGTNNLSCNDMATGDMASANNGVIYMLADGISYSGTGGFSDCAGTFGNITDACIYWITVDVNGPQKGKNLGGQDIFYFILSDSIGLVPIKSYNDDAQNAQACYSSTSSSGKANYCTFWPLEYGNLDYLKTDSEGKCNDSNIILDGTTNTSCH